MTLAPRTESDQDGHLEVDEVPFPELRLPPNTTFLRALKQGSPVETFLARNELDGQKVIVKRVALADAKEWKCIDLFEREARVLASLSHPSIPAFLQSNAIEHPEGPLSLFIIQQCIEGQSLAAYAANHVVDEAFARRIAHDVLEVLAYLQTFRPPIVHRDIKPSNLILRPDGGISVIDFGALQYVVRSDQTVGSTIIGTPGFVAPEQMMGRAIPASDLYGLGATLIQVVSGVHPSDLPSTGMRIDFEEYVKVSPGFTRFLARLIAPSVTDRFASAAVALRALSALNTSTVTSNPMPVQPNHAGWTLTPSRNRRILATLGIGSILLIATLWFSGVYEMRSRNTRLEVGLPTQAGEVTLAQARVFIEGTLVCTGIPCDLTIEPGYHRVRVEIPGRDPQNHDIDVSRGGVSRLTIIP